MVLGKLRSKLGLFVCGVLLTSGSGFAQTPAPDAPPKKVDRRAPDYVRCRILDVTGSLVKKEKVCKTNQEWEELRSRNNSEAQRFIEQNRTGSNPNG